MQVLEYMARNCAGTDEFGCTRSQARDRFRQPGRHKFDRLAARCRRNTQPEEAPVKFVVGFKIDGKTDHVIVDAEDALIAALRVKAQRPDAAITYARHANKRGDARHPGRGSEKESR
jgi:hypothetical protein